MGIGIWVRRNQVSWSCFKSPCLTLLLVICITFPILYLASMLHTMVVLNRYFRGMLITSQLKKLKNNKQYFKKVILAQLWAQKYLIDIIYAILLFLLLLVNRPGVARAVLQTPLSLINSLSESSFVPSPPICVLINKIGGGNFYFLMGY